MSDDKTNSPVNAAMPPKADPLGAAKPSTLRLKPIIRKEGAAPSPAVAPKSAAAAVEASKSKTSSMEQLKSVTQSLKSVTAPIPQQAILHKTGIIADPGLTEAQIQASKSRTSRISLSDAVGAAPVKNDASPMKTIRIKRPTDLENGPNPTGAAPKPTGTGTKTLKLSTTTSPRPTVKFGIKKPAGAAAPAADEVADIPEMPNAPLAAAAATGERDVPHGLLVFDLILQIAASIAIGFLAYRLYVDTTILTF